VRELKNGLHFMIPILEKWMGTCKEGLSDDSESENITGSDYSMKSAEAE
jgi:hypothetical protein